MYTGFFSCFLFEVSKRSLLQMCLEKYLANKLCFIDLAEDINSFNLIQNEGGMFEYINLLCASPNYLENCLYVVGGMSSVPCVFKQ